ncbi:DNA sulfur modification protein DndD [Sinomicrobium oceani]|uniref:DNA sulfur modification protein DndD n=1 Tax=Sinomicrobium oceani TaxID=1150368 RepID=A0A1K1RWT5_9FLAO|nr:DNA sulfur modification protein DndD [Sinomicrobium oceani]SFW76632.1 DNA sulfur modification protein DndD [Sinomicrobium oceani]
MKINRIKFQNFRIYGGENEIHFNSKSKKNISIIAGKNGFGKTTFLTSLIWVFYGKMMVEVEEKYKRDIKNVGGYEKFLTTLLNRDLKSQYDDKKVKNAELFVEIEIDDLAIPSIPCKSVVIRRSFNFHLRQENLTILIDGLENELTKEVGYEIFINDFILPREIAKFFFFDAEKIVTLAEAKSKSELKNLSRAYSEVLGIKKYEDLKKNLETLLIKLRRNSARPEQQEKLKKLIETENQLNSFLELNEEKIATLNEQIITSRKQSDSLQEKLIREGNKITLEELEELKFQQKHLKTRSEEIKERLKKMMDLAPIVMAGEKLQQLTKQLELEQDSAPELKIGEETFKILKQSITKKINDLEIAQPKINKILDAIQQSIQEQQEIGKIKQDILLDYTPKQYREFKAVLDNIRNGFNTQFQSIVREDKNNRIALSKVSSKIKQAEARKDNPLATKLRKDKMEVDHQIIQLSQEKGKLLEESSNLKMQLTNNHKVLSEYEKNFNLIAADKVKSEVTENLLKKINAIIQKIKEDKKYSLQKSILLGLKKIMHKNDFIYGVKVNVYEGVIDIDLLDKNDQIINKDSLSKGEQQLYATALLKALVDESGIKFPVFIDSPLQKFDKFHSQNIIKEFYPTISEQVVLLPLLEKELSEIEYDYLKPYVNNVYTIENARGVSGFNTLNVDDLFKSIKKEDDYVYTSQD